MRQYESIWLQIKTVPTKQEVAVRVHCDASKTLIQAVKLEKTKQVAVKKRLGILTQGHLNIRVTEDTQKKCADFCIIYFSLKWDYSKL